MKKFKKLIKRGQYVGSKWSKTKVLLQNKLIRKYIPKTRKLNKRVLKSMLKEFKMIYLKPVNGTAGRGVIRAEKLKSNGKKTYKYQQGKEKRKFPSVSALYRKIKKSKVKRPYIAQQGIHLLKHKNRLFDLRIMVQRNSEKEWETTGIIGRAAHPQKIVTNYHNGGTPLSFKKIFKSHLTARKTKKYKKTLKKFGKDVAGAMSHKYPKLNMLGVDVGVDKKLTPWIIEVNTNPDLYIFKQLKDKATFHKIYRYAKQLKRA
ncbi:YheC/YheD family protein [Paenibacillus psychroresistens]|uniref:YheC/YheD family protein n=1 Tax=Paenibacillus psychroresistens TaxID=1778678 RepID=A0A6B8RLK5_9BACL|nr:YheC/YheD family protein [Paenibacillus psychroresistens]QGQ96522.1 YheC/YheD family protein [Paenibacillus psychroresistens]